MHQPPTRVGLVASTVAGAVSTDLCQRALVIVAGLPRTKRAGKVCLASCREGYQGPEAGDAEI